MFWILTAATLLRLFGLTWGLPASDGWDDDGVAPRNFLVGVVQTFAPGSYFTYPPLHMILLMVLTLPGWLLALHSAHSHARQDVITAFIQVPYMTFFAVVARAVSIAMSVATIFMVGRMTMVIAGRRAGLAAAAACTLNATLTYYGQVTNLDGPYLFWSVLALWGWMRIVAEQELHHLRWAMLATVAAIATKDQAYALFLLGLPALLLLWFGLDPWARNNARAIVPRLLVWAGIALLALLAIDGALTNPAGFAKRIAFLTGPASQDYAQYQADLRGRLSLLQDAWAYFPRSYPAAAAGLGVMGIALHLGRHRDRPQLLVAGLLPLLAMVSFTLAFNLVALRSENRFLLPQSVLMACYIGIAVDRVAFAARLWVRYPGRVLIFGIALAAFCRCAAIDAAIAGDPRYDAERWMAAALRPGDRIEAYGLNTFLPRFPAMAVVTRLDRKPLALRNPLPHVTELDQPFQSVTTRNPRFLVVNGFWVKGYLQRALTPPGDGRITQETQQALFRETATAHYFTSLFDDELPYRLVHISSYRPQFWPAVDGYESLAQNIFIFERTDVPHRP